MRNSADHILDAGALTWPQLALGGMCALTTLANGMSTQMIAFVLPDVRQEFALSPLSSGALASITLGAMVVGSITGGTISDHIGRPRTLQLAVVVFASMTALTSLTSDYRGLAVMRFLTGLGLGAQIPVVATILTECVPERLRGRIVTSVLACFSLGWAVAGVIALLFIPLLGWRSAFLVAAWPLILIPFIGLLIPESPRFLVQHGRLTDALKALQRLVPSAVLEGMVLTPADSGTRQRWSRLPELWKHGYARATALLWAMSFFNFLLIYAIAVWLPTLLVERGYSLVSSFVTILPIYCAGAVGGLLVGWLLDLVGHRLGMAAYWTAAGISILLLGGAESATSVLVLGSLAAFFGFGSQLGLEVIACQRYPTSFRATGLGWAIGVGRLGALVGPVAAGSLFLYTNDFSTFFAVFALPTVVCLALLSALPRDQIGSLIAGEVG